MKNVAKIAIFSIVAAMCLSCGHDHGKRHHHKKECSRKCQGCGD